MIVVGIDENGLGPLLGPLVVTAAAFETDIYDREAFFASATKHLPADDSKKVFSKTKMASAESATLSWLRTFRVETQTFSGVMSQVAKHPVPLLCDGIPDHCAPSETPLPFATLPEEIETRDFLPLLESEGIRPRAVRTVSLCPGGFNKAIRNPGTNKFSLDFELMMHLVRDLRAELGEELRVFCGKVGGTRRYGPWFQKAGMDAWWIEEETPELSTYRVTGIGKVSFVRDGDASHLPIAVASMVGKYVRELAMRDLNAHLKTEGVREASGYHNKVTADFVTGTEQKRNTLGLEDVCFKRDA